MLLTIPTSQEFTFLANPYERMNEFGRSIKKLLLDRPEDVSEHVETDVWRASSEAGK